MLTLETKDAEYVMGYPDDLKLRSCMTLFQAAEPDCRIFQAVLDKFFRGKPDEKTLRIFPDMTGSVLLPVFTTAVLRSSS